ncbi:MAG: DUF1844 domain-containing protein [Planctomycetota bacterium]|nr:MAG: DUF1844 domain-containing protein [Planctomycetota bacterium]
MEKQEQTSEGGRPAGEPEANFIELLNLIAMQAAVALGGLQGPGGESIPPNPLAAKHYIDLLEVLEKKTAGNLTDDERRVLGSVLYELRMQYVQMVTAATQPPKADKSGPAEPPKA